MQKKMLPGIHDAFITCTSKGIKTILVDYILLAFTKLTFFSNQIFKILIFFFKFSPLTSISVVILQNLSFYEDGIYWR
jgi:hypothetical protein